MTVVRCPRPECRAELFNPRIDLCPDCHTIRPGSVRSQLLEERAPRCICQHCSTVEQPMFIFPKPVGDASPLFHKGALNVTDYCPNPFCQGKNPVQVPSGYGWFGNLLLGLGYWLLPLAALLFIACFGLPESPNAALNRLAAAPWWHTLPKSGTTRDWYMMLEKAAIPDLQQFAIWGVKMLGFYSMIGLSFWATLVPRMQVTRKAVCSIKGFSSVGRIIYVAFSLAFVLCCVLTPIVAFVPSAASAMAVPAVLAFLAAMATYIGFLLLLDFALPLLQLATFSLYGIEWERFTRKCCQAIGFLHQWLGFNHEVAPIPQILVLLVGTLLVKVYGFGWAILIVMGLGIGTAIGMLLGAIVFALAEPIILLLFGLGFLLVFPFILGWEKFQTWHSSRSAKRP